LHFWTKFFEDETNFSIIFRLSKIYGEASCRLAVLQMWRNWQDLKADADRSRELLHRLLPASIADDLKADKISLLDRLYNYDGNVTWRPTHSFSDYFLDYTGL